MRTHLAVSIEMNIARPTTSTPAATYTPPGMEAVVMSSSTPTAAIPAAVTPVAMTNGSRRRTRKETGPTIALANSATVNVDITATTSPAFSEAAPNGRATKAPYVPPA
ncbi:hypothetical protein GCM10022224_088070 [Nonomuraea antimicrobica]|uniref:Uncharacterized protein n=1 Tax=Nonomuraea antimicrobica TaxID=561173 RepID=A0ABP7DTQ2_9ACTN